MKPITAMTPREREHLIRELEIEHRVSIVEAAKIRRQIRELQVALDAKEQRIGEIVDGISVLRDI